VQAVLRRAWGRLGRPEWLRVDNGHPWGGTGGLPTGLELWAAGLHVRLTRNRARRPQENGVVERSQGTADRWAGPATCRDAQELQRRLEAEDRVQRQEYPALAGRTRLESYPGLLHSGRGYALGWERVGWDLEAALACLARRAVRRKVSREGKVSLYDRGVMVGREYAGQEVWVRLEATTREWLVSAPAGPELRRRPAVGLDQDDIVNLRVSRPRSNRAVGQPEPVQGGQTYG